MAQIIQVHKLTSDSPVVALRAGDDAVADLDRGERRPRREDGAASGAFLQGIFLLRLQSMFEISRSGHETQNAMYEYVQIC